MPRIIFVNVTDDYIQNRTFDNINIDYYYIPKSIINVGHNVTTLIPEGNVRIESGSTLNIINSKGVKINNSFKSERGGKLWIGKF